eukprot:TRINITY_DN337_c0_g5_i1.p1 TRINITY_DN337_c0_g5~~TRINITY_DN337_c0_g5_i1.p1  ORF type:complete len:1159 (-),score=215.41 TRINITY_DN337_c0_g5_i1:54-3530(-)
MRRSRSAKTTTPGAFSPIPSIPEAVEHPTTLDEALLVIAQLREENYQLKQEVDALLYCLNDEKGVRLSTHKKGKKFRRFSKKSSDKPLQQGDSPAEGHRSFSDHQSPPSYTSTSASSVTSNEVPSASSTSPTSHPRLEPPGSPPSNDSLEGRETVVAFNVDEDDELLQQEAERCSQRGEDNPEVVFSQSLPVRPRNVTAPVQVSSSGTLNSLSPKARSRSMVQENADGRVRAVSPPRGRRHRVARVLSSGEGSIPQRSNWQRSSKSQSTEDLFEVKKRPNSPSPTRKNKFDAYTSGFRSGKNSFDSPDTPTPLSEIASDSSSPPFAPSLSASQDVPHRSKKAKSATTSPRERYREALSAIPAPGTSPPTSSPHHFSDRAQRRKSTTILKKTLEAIGTHLSLSRQPSITEDMQLTAPVARKNLSRSTPSSPMDSPVLRAEKAPIVFDPPSLSVTTPLPSSSSSAGVLFAGDSIAARPQRPSLRATTESGRRGMWDNNIIPFDLTTLEEQTMIIWSKAVDLLPCDVDFPRLAGRVELRVDGERKGGGSPSDGMKDNVCNVLCDMCRLVEKSDALAQRVTDIATSFQGTVGDEYDYGMLMKELLPLFRYTAPAVPNGAISPLLLPNEGPDEGPPLHGPDTVNTEHKHTMQTSQPLSPPPSPSTSSPLSSAESTSSPTPKNSESSVSPSEAHLADATPQQTCPHSVGSETIATATAEAEAAAAATPASPSGATTTHPGEVATVVVPQSTTGPAPSLLETAEPEGTAANSAMSTKEEETDSTEGLRKWHIHMRASQANMLHRGSGGSGTDPTPITTSSTTRTVVSPYSPTGSMSSSQALPETMDVEPVSAVSLSLSLPLLPPINGLSPPRSPVRTFAEARLDGGSTGQIQNILKACTQSVIAPVVMHMKIGLGSVVRYTSKAKGWFIAIDVCEGAIHVCHSRTEKASMPPPYFEFSYEIHLVFDQAVNNLLSLDVELCDVTFDPSENADPVLCANLKEHIERGFQKTRLQRSRRGVTPRGNKSDTPFGSSSSMPTTPSGCSTKVLTKALNDSKKSADGPTPRSVKMLRQSSTPIVTVINPTFKGSNTDPLVPPPDLVTVRNPAYRAARKQRKHKKEKEKEDASVRSAVAAAVVAVEIPVCSGDENRTDDTKAGTVEEDAQEVT